MPASRRLRRQNRRHGAILVLIGLLMMILLGMVALAVDIGFIQVTRTQLQSASDAGSLAGGTELLPGLGASAFRTPAQVQANAEAQAVAFVAEHPAGDAPSANIVASRDVRMGQGYLDIATGVWSFQWGVAPYNAVGVTTLRGNTGTTAGDGPLPLIFAPVLGTDFAEVTVDSAAVILPASGIRIPPGSGIGSGLSPFAFYEKTWKKYWRARQYFVNNGLNASSLRQGSGGHQIMDAEDLDANGNPKPLFYENVPIGNSGNTQLRQLFDDKYRVVDPAAGNPENIVVGADGVLEANIYPLSNSSSGNYGTVDIGNLNNSTSDLSRQIRDGISEEDLEGFANNTFNPNDGAPILLQGDTGISAGLEAAIEDIIGQCREIVLYREVNNPGNNALYTIVEIVGIRIMAVQFSGKNKVLVIQPCSVSDPAGVPDFDDQIGEDTTFFTPLILAR